MKRVYTVAVVLFAYFFIMALASCLPMQYTLPLACTAAVAAMVFGAFCVTIYTSIEIWKQGEKRTLQRIIIYIIINTVSVYVMWICMNHLEKGNIALGSFLLGVPWFMAYTSDTLAQPLVKEKGGET